MGWCLFVWVDGLCVEGAEWQFVMGRVATDHKGG